MVKPDDIIGGLLNTDSIKYGDYQIEFSKTPDENGLVNIFLDGLHDFPEINSQKNFLMLEYKDLNAPDTDYVIYRRGDIGNSVLSRFSLIRK